jgi:hypothetical protein
MENVKPNGKEHSESVAERATFSCSDRSLGADLIRMPTLRRQGSAKTVGSAGSPRDEGLCPRSAIAEEAFRMLLKKQKEDESATEWPRHRKTQSQRSTLESRSRSASPRAYPVPAVYWAGADRVARDSLYPFW